jgi:hypothetical protein
MFGMMWPCLFFAFGFTISSTFEFYIPCKISQNLRFRSAYFIGVEIQANHTMSAETRSNFHSALAQNRNSQALTRRNWI